LLVASKILLLHHLITESSLPLGVSCDKLTPVNSEKSSVEGSAATLSYTYTKLSGGDYFLWYRQYPGKPPQFLIPHSGSGEIGNNPVTGLKVEVEQTQINLEIISANVSDSAVYYCALSEDYTQ
uniref:Immunoglobulin V-set domain-containing protein n=1 Tax=Monopterus albus TaxID=43700 RepID=A0A3Q3IML3_MONAL